MAVYQISRIQIRRGKKNTTGLPQLASGEMAWAVDTQQLFIGNGSVSEGAPAVGNTRVLTEVDLTTAGNLLSIAEYSYKGSTSYPIRTIQSRLDDQITTTDFGTNGDGILVNSNDVSLGYTGTDNTVSLQYAIDQLFLNPSSPASGDNGVSNRVKLNIPAGVYVITDTVYIPSHTTLIGAGSDKTIIYFKPAQGVTGPAFQFVNDLSTPGNPSPLTDTLYSNQPRNIWITGLTIQSASAANVCLMMDAVRDSEFYDLDIQGAWTGASAPNSIGVQMNALTSLVTCENLIFSDVTFEKLYTGVYAKKDILNNSFETCSFVNLYKGLALGIEANGVADGQKYGPRQTSVINCDFRFVRAHAVHIDRGQTNTVTNCRFKDVGNNGGGNANPEFPQIYFNSYGNEANNVQSDRADAMSSANLTTKYVAEVAGHCTYDSYGTRKQVISKNNAPSFVFRLPLACDVEGVPSGSIFYNIDYFYKSIANPSSGFSRIGALTISADADNKKIQLSDEYNYAGFDPDNTQSLLIDFSAKFLDQLGAPYTGAPGQMPTSLAVFCLNIVEGDIGHLDYSYTAII